MDMDLELAHAILRSAEVYDRSFDDQEYQQDQANNAVKSDLDSYHWISLMAACEQVNTKLSQPVYVLLTNSWNEMIDWAKKVTQLTKK